MFEFKTYDAGTRLKAKSLLAASLVGGGSGVVAALSGSGDVLTTAFLGILLVLAGGHAGGFAGLMIRGVLAGVRRKGGPGGGIDVIMPALSFGALVGLVFALIVASWKDAHLGAAVGAVLGGLAGGLAGESVGDMLNLITIVEGGGKMPRSRKQDGRLDIVDFKERDPDEK